MARKSALYFTHWYTGLLTRGHYPLPLLGEYPLLVSLPAGISGNVVEIPLDRFDIQNFYLKAGLSTLAFLKTRNLDSKKPSKGPVSNLRAQKHPKWGVLRSGNIGHPPLIWKALSEASKMPEGDLVLENG